MPSSQINIKLVEFIFRSETEHISPPLLKENTKINSTTTYLGDVINPVLNHLKSKMV
jgi:hypothetical protein